MARSWLSNLDVEGMGVWEAGHVVYIGIDSGDPTDKEASALWASARCSVPSHCGFAQDYQARLRRELDDYSDRDQRRWDRGALVLASVGAGLGGDSGALKGRNIIAPGETRGTGQTKMNSLTLKATP